MSCLIFRWESSDESSSVASNVNKISNKPAFENEKPSRVVLKKKDDLFDNSDSEDDLFSSEKPAMTNKSSSSYLPESKSSFNSSPRSSNSLSSKTTSSPFYSEIKQSESDKEDDLFSSTSTTNTSFNTKVTDLFSDDLFSYDSNSSFSNNVPVNPKSKSYKDTVSVEDDDPLFSSVDSLKKSFSKNAKSNFVNDIFPDEVDLFGSTTKVKDDNLFDAPSFSKNSDNVLKNTQKIPVSTSFRPSSRGLFGDDEDDDLFSTNVSTNVPPSKNTVEQNRLDNNKINTLVPQSKQPISTNENDDLFSSSHQITEVRSDKVKVKSGNLKPKKALERRSLFDSDSDDDLFSSPQGSLSSRKSLQATNTHVINKPDVHKQQKPSNQETIPTKIAKTDFSSIFSNEASNIFSNSHKVSVVSADSLFDEEKDLFYQTNNTNVKTPDLFTNTSSQNTTSKSSEPNNDSLAVSNSYTHNKETSSIDKISAIEAVNPELASSSKEVSNSVPEISSEIRTKVVSSSVSNKPEIKHKKPEPPKSLGIKPISETLSGALPKENVKVSQSSEFPKQSLTTVTPNDALDGEAVSVPTPSKAKPGRCKYGILLNIVDMIGFV